jgi:hypothetical protein
MALCTAICLICITSFLARRVHKTKQQVPTSSFAARTLIVPKPDSTLYQHHRHHLLLGVQLAVEIFMSSSSSSSLELVPSSETKSTSTSMSPRFSWFHQSPCYDMELSSNASFVPRGLLIVDTADNPDWKLRFERPKGVAAGSILEASDREGKGGMNLDGTQQPNSHNLLKVIRSRPTRSHHRAFHADQAYSHLSLELSSSWNSEELPFELPQTTSPARSKGSRLRHTWLAPLDSSFRIGCSPAIYLSLYFGFNLGLTLYNKSLLIHFPYPYTLSAVHALCGSIGSTVLIRAGSSPPPRLNIRESLILLAFSVLYTVNIAISNVSLGLVTVPVSHFLLLLNVVNLCVLEQFHQVVRASTPLFTILFSSIILGTRSTRPKLMALIPVVVGVGFACVEDQFSI